MQNEIWPEYEILVSTRSQKRNLFSKRQRHLKLRSVFRYSVELFSMNLIVARLASRQLLRGSMKSRSNGNEWIIPRSVRRDSAARCHSERLSIEFIACISRAGDCTRRCAALCANCNLSSLGVREECLDWFIRRRVKSTRPYVSLLRVSLYARVKKRWHFSAHFFFFILLLSSSWFTTNSSSRRSQRTRL